LSLLAGSVLTFPPRIQTMILKILGSAAGGGFPQWNCCCRNCSGLRDGMLHAKPRTQTQIAFSPAAGVWFLVGASPDLRTQIVANPEVWPSPQRPGRSPIAGVFLTSADVDAVMGLLHLREFQNFSIFATPSVRRIVREQNSLFGVLDRADPPVQWQELVTEHAVGFRFPDSPYDLPAFVYTTVSLGRNYPEYAVKDFHPNASAEDANVGFVIEQAGKKIFIALALSGENAVWCKHAASADIVLLDGTFWSDRELLVTGRTQKMARAMGHLPLSGPDGLLARYPTNARGRKILIHINNTNPILDENSDEHKTVVEAGFEIAYDGLSIEL
jgi:pyrroloquinoline quinone biosynthesis protein B